MGHRGSATVEAVMIMVVYLMVIFMVIRAFFALGQGVGNYCKTQTDSVTIEKTVGKMRGVQWASGQGATQ